MKSWRNLSFLSAIIMIFGILFLLTGCFGSGSKPDETPQASQAPETSPPPQASQAPETSPLPQTSSSSAAYPGQAEAKALFDDRCSYCHSLDRILYRKASPIDWKILVDTMQIKSMGRISDSDAAIITRYLSETQSL